MLFLIRQHKNIFINFLTRNIINSYTPISVCNGRNYIVNQECVPCKGHCKDGAPCDKLTGQCNSCADFWMGEFCDGTCAICIIVPLIGSFFFGTTIWQRGFRNKMTAWKNVAVVLKDGRNNSYIFKHYILFTNG